MTHHYPSIHQLRAMRLAKAGPLKPAHPAMQQTVRSLISHGYLTHDGCLARRGRAFLQHLDRSPA